MSNIHYLPNHAPHITDDELRTRIINAATADHSFGHAIVAAITLRRVKNDPRFKKKVVASLLAT